MSIHDQQLPASHWPGLRARYDMTKPIVGEFIRGESAFRGFDVDFTVQFGQTGFPRTTTNLLARERLIAEGMTLRTKSNMTFQTLTEGRGVIKGFCRTTAPHHSWIDKKATSKFRICSSIPVRLYDLSCNYIS